MTNHTPGLPDHTITSLLADTDPYLSCDDCFARLDEYAERRTDPNYDDPAMYAHLLGCGACADEANALLDLLNRDAG